MDSEKAFYNSRLIYILMFSVAFFWGLAWPVGRILATDLLNYPFSVMFLGIFLQFQFYSAGYGLRKEL